MTVVSRFFTRHGGVSRGIYASLNCGLGSRDDQADIRENRRRVGEAMAGERLLSVYQIHSARCIAVDAAWADDAMPQADAMATDRPGLMLGILTADCGPVLFEGAKPNGSPVIGAAHAGWGGAVGGVLEATLDAMAGLGADRASIRAAIGPCIGQPSYEVSDGFERPFLTHHEGAGAFFAPGRVGHLHFDLPGYIRFRLNLAGVEQVTVDGRDTCADEESFFSFRRATLRGGADYGRQISVITIRA